MNKQDIFKSMVATASQLSVEQLKEQIILFYNDISTENADVILNVFLDAIKGKITSEEFVAFCNSID